MRINLWYSWLIIKLFSLHQVKISLIRIFLFVAYSILLGCCVLWPSLQLLVILCVLCSCKNIRGGHGWHRILKYNYALHVQLSFILQSLKCISLMSRGFSQYPASVCALPWIIFQTNQSNERWPSTALSVPTNLGNPWSKQGSSKTW